MDTSLTSGRVRSEPEGVIGCGLPLERLPGERRPLDERVRLRGRGMVVPASFMGRLSLIIAESAGPASVMGVRGGPLSRGIAERAKEPSTIGVVKRTVPASRTPEDGLNRSSPDAFLMSA